MSQDTATTAGPSAAGVPAGEARINFAAHQVRANAQGARQDFEEMIGQLVHAVRPGVARMVARSAATGANAAKEDFELEQWILCVLSSTDADEPPYGLIEDEVT